MDLGSNMGGTPTGMSSLSREASTFCRSYAFFIFIASFVERFGAIDKSIDASAASVTGTRLSLGKTED